MGWVENIEGKGEKCCLPAFFPFPTIIVKGFLFQGCQKLRLCHKGLIAYLQTQIKHHAFFTLFQTPIDIVKMDIRGSEWLTLRQMLDAKSLQGAKVKTLIVTFDIVNDKRDLHSYLYMLRVLRELNELGYRRYFFRMWWHNCLIKDSKTGVERTGCHEVHFLKV